MATFTIDGFVKALNQAMDQSDDRREAARQFLQQTMNNTSKADIIDVLEAAIPAGADIGEMIVYSSPNLTLLYGRMPPRFQSGIHNHTVCAVIGQLEGTEINTLYTRTEDGKGLKQVSTKTVNAGEAIAMNKDAIHRIENPHNTAGKALHIYAGDFTAISDRRSLWSSDKHEELPFSFQDLLKESVKGMQLSDNQSGLDEIVKAIPAVKNLLNNKAAVNQ